MAKKKLSVPEEGTQKAPIENLIKGKVSTPPQPLKKRPTSFYLDPQMIDTFKAVCKAKGANMTMVIEQLIADYLAIEKMNAERLNDIFK